MIRNNNILFILLVSICLTGLLPELLHGQQEKKHLIEGNTQYHRNNYAEAEKSYKKAASVNKNSYKSIFNLGDSYYKQNKFEEAAEQFQMLTHRATSKDTLSKVYHNLGNSLLKSKKFEESISAYKNALKNNPKDDESRYNLAYAQQMIKKQQEQQKKNQEQKDKDKKEDKKKDEKKEEPKEKKKDKDKKEEQKPGGMSEKEADRALDALQNNERELHNKTQKNSKGVNVEIEKDW